MNANYRAFASIHLLLGEYATRLIAQLACRLALLLGCVPCIVEDGRCIHAGADPASSPCLASRPASRTLGRVQLRFLV